MLYRVTQIKIPEKQRDHQTYPLQERVFLSLRHCCSSIWILFFLISMSCCRRSLFFSRRWRVSSADAICCWKWRFYYLGKSSNNFSVFFQVMDIRRIEILRYTNSTMLQIPTPSPTLRSNLKLNVRQNLYKRKTLTLRASWEPLMSLISDKSPPWT